MIKPPKKILLAQPGFIGDVILVSPLAHSLKAAFPDSKLVMLVRPQRAELAESIPAVDRVEVFDKRGKDSGPTGLLRMARKIRELEFDLLLSPHRSTRTALLSYLSGIELRVGFRIGFGRFAYNIAIAVDKKEPCRLEQEFSLLRAVGVEAISTRPVLKAPDAALAYARDFLAGRKVKGEKCIGLCIGANWSTKRWPVAHFARLAAMLLDEGYEPVLFGGPGEKDLEESVQREFSKIHEGELLSCVGNKLMDAMGLLSACAAVVGGDTGLVHMARAVDTPVVMIYGPTDERLHHHHDKELVLVADLDCRPCHRHGQVRCPLKHHKCMRDVRPEQVYGAMVEVLRGVEKT